MKRGILLLLLGMAINVQSQINCSYDNNSGDPNQGYLLWPENVTSYTLFDPANEADLPNCNATYPYILNSIEMSVADAGWFNNPDPADGNVKFQIGVYKLLDSLDACAGVGENLFLSNEYSIDVGNTLNEMYVPTGGIEINGPFFVTWRLNEWVGFANQVMTPVWDGLPRPNCQQFYSGDDGNTFITHEAFFNTTFGWMDIRINGSYDITAFSKLQVVNASADSEVETVDIRVNGEFPDDCFNDLDFRSGTISAIIPAGSNTVTINPATSIDDSTPLATIDFDFVEGENYIGVVHGISSSSGYSPSSNIAPLTMTFINPSQESAIEDGDTDIAIFHAITDAPSIDVEVQGGAPVATGIAYGEFDPYSGLTNNDYNIVLNESGLGLIQDYVMPLEMWALENLAAVIVANGFITPSDNSNGPLFGMWLALPNCGEMLELPFIDGVSEYYFSSISVYPNPASDFFSIDQFTEGLISAVEVYSLSGSLVAQFDYSGINAKFNIPTLESGVYFVQFLDKNSHLLGRSKLVKK